MPPGRARAFSHCEESCLGQDASTKRVQTHLAICSFSPESSPRLRWRACGKNWLPARCYFVAFNSKELREQLQKRRKRLYALLPSFLVEAWLLPAQLRCRRTNKHIRPSCDGLRKSVCVLLHRVCARPVDARYIVQWLQGRCVRMDREYILCRSLVALGVNDGPVQDLCDFKDACRPIWLPLALKTLCVI